MQPFVVGLRRHRVPCLKPLHPHSNDSLEVGRVEKAAIDSTTSTTTPSTMVSSAGKPGTRPQADASLVQVGVTNRSRLAAVALLVRTGIHQSLPCIDHLLPEDKLVLAA